MIKTDMNALPLVSAIITTHNRKALAKKAVDSVLSQTYVNLELIVVDDASTDGTKEMMEAYAIERDFQYFYISPNESKGGNYARNVGIRRSRGEYVAFLDDDDEWFPEKTQKQVEVLSSNPECGAVGCLKIYEQDYELRTKQQLSASMRGDAHELIFTRIPFITSSTMIKKSVLEECGLFDENLGFWQEYELSIRYCQITKVDFVDDYLCLYRIITTDKNRLTNKLEGWEHAIEYIEEKHSKLIGKLPIEIYNKHRLLIANDGLNRARTVGSRKKEVYYSWSAFKIARSRSTIKNLILSVTGTYPLYKSVMKKLNPTGGKKLV